MPQYKKNFEKEYFEKLLTTVVSSNNLYDRREAIHELRSQLQQLEYELQALFLKEMEKQGCPFTREKRAGSGVPY